MKKPVCGHPKVRVAVSSWRELVKGGAFLPWAAVIIKAAVKQSTQDVKCPSDNVWYQNKSVYSAVIYTEYLLLRSGERHNRKTQFAQTSPVDTNWWLQLSDVLNTEEQRGISVALFFCRAVGSSVWGCCTTKLLAKPGKTELKTVAPNSAERVGGDSPWESINIFTFPEQAFLFKASPGIFYFVWGWKWFWK